MKKDIKKILLLSRKVLKRVLPIGIYEPIENAIRIRFDPQFKDDYVKYKSFGGLNADKTFYVLRYDFPKAGIYTVCFDFLPQLEWAEEQGYIPVIDLKNYSLPQWGTDDKGNLWELYFQPVSSVASLEEVYKSKNVILGWKNGMSYKNPFKRPDWNNIESFSKESIERWGKIFNRYMVLNSDLLGRADDFYEYNIKGKRVLGVVMRECYRWCALVMPELGNSHPILFTPDQSIQYVEKYMQEQKYEYIFLVSDDEECALKFREHYGSKCLLFCRSRKAFFREGKPTTMTNIISHGTVEDTNDYLVEIEILSRCTGIFSGITSGTAVALMRNQGKYENVEIYDNGRYDLY